MYIEAIKQSSPQSPPVFSSQASFYLEEALSKANDHMAFARVPEPLLCASLLYDDVASVGICRLDHLLS